jgi:hypothetical protein
MISELAQNSPPTQDEGELIASIQSLENQLGLTIHRDFFPSQQPAAPPVPPAPAPQPVPEKPALQRVPEEERVYSEEEQEPMERVGSMGRDPSDTRKRYESFLRNCVSDNRTPGNDLTGANILKTITELLEDLPPTEEERELIASIQSLENQLGLTIHRDVFASQQSAAPTPPPPPLQPVQPLEKKVEPPQEQANLPESNPADLRKQYEAYLRSAVKNQRAAGEKVINMMTQLAKEKPPTQNEMGLIESIQSLESQLGLTIHRDFFPSRQSAPPAAASSAPPLAAKSKLAREMLESLSVAEDLRALPDAERDALLTSLIRTLAAVQEKK